MVGTGVGAAVVGDPAVGATVGAAVSAGAKAGAGGGGGGGGGGVGRLQLFVTSLQRNVHLRILFKAPNIITSKVMDISLA